MSDGDVTDRAALEAAVRQVADEYLKDPNINSVGLGYKVVDGKRTDELALQFTVDEKLAPEALESAATTAIPDQITTPNGITLPTDVIPRAFETHPVLVELGVKPDRKRRLDPMQPGVSVGNARSQDAGTLGCLVADRASGAIRMLSNWHVFHGPDGQLGDAIAQPGLFDDNRAEANVCGKLERSFLGLAGDCAIASIAGRPALDETLELGVAVRQIADPALGDRLVKSGRTTAVTYGVVIRIHTVSKLRYGTEQHQIGGFEIGPDDERPAENGEISMGGDSGSAWMAVDADGDATDVMVGLHFAGETGGEPEHALACQASSVFEKLEIRPLEPQVEGAIEVVPQIGGGYDPGFLVDHPVPLPVAVQPAIEADYAPTRAGEHVRHYTHFSLAMSASRRFCRWVAWNIDGGAIKRLSREGIDFVVDPAYDRRFQVDNELYKNDPLDRGHIARRADLLWGTLPEAEAANRDSFYYSNITPQLETFNRASENGLWGRVEDGIFDEVSVDRLRVSVFGGPIFGDADFPFRGVLVPRSFWKLIAYVENGTLAAKAYLLTQEDLEDQLETLGLEPFKLFQIPLGELTRRTGLDFGPLLQADTAAVSTPEAVAAAAPRVPGARRIRSDDEIVA
ncbi:MAG TPA: DNA/RNA non-specific endonuclease [Conexibacter sp.]|nr:DNA/RNA non-specific endonuclease [Conexibacter sp.]